MGYFGAHGTEQVKQLRKFKNRRETSIFSWKEVSDYDTSQMEMGGMDKQASTELLMKIREEKRRRNRIQMFIFVGLLLIVSVAGYLVLN